MIEQAISKIADMARGQLPQFVKVPGIENEMFLVNCDGTSQRLPTSMPPRNHTVFDVEAMATYCFAVYEAGTNHVVIWYSRTGVVAILNDDDRRDQRVRLPLAMTQQFKTVEMLATHKPNKDQRAMLTLLRNDLSGCLDLCPGLVSTLRGVNWKATAEESSEIRQGKASLSKSQMAQLSGLADIPEDVTLSVPIFEGHNIRSQVHCTLDVDADNKVFILRPKAGEIEMAMRSAEQALGDLLATKMSGAGMSSDSFGLHYGQP